MNHVETVASLTLSPNVGTITSTVAPASDAGAAAAPTITLTRDSATPAANDIIGQIDFRGEDNASNSDSFAKIQGKITDPTSGSEDGTLEVVVKTGGNDQTIAFPTTSGTLALTSDLSSAFPSGGIIMCLVLKHKFLLDGYYVMGLIALQT